MASNNSSKTAHVMNLLSKNRGGASEPPAAEPKAAAAPQAETAPQAEAAPPAAPAAEPARTAPVAPIISSITADAAVSSQIKDALEAELGGADPKPPVRPETPQPAAVQQEAPVRQAAPVQQEAPAPQAAPVQEAPAAPVQAAPASQAPVQEEEKPNYINVMQILVEEKADEAIGKRLLLPEDREACVEHAVAKAIKYGLEGGC